ncbi:MAG TPA: NAD(P)H-hydrate dehydratase [Gammaproteobacteria bacterium]|nr:NAD(P)H-hydrate dehydratase [Gammaproteobacteria bacterium]
MRGPEERLPSAVYSASQIRDLERLAPQRDGIASYELMTRAGAAALAVLRRRWPAAGRVLVYCGPGNNGGDGYVLARDARAAGLEAAVVALVPPERLKGDAARAARDCRDGGVPIEPYDPRSSAIARHAPQVLVDALLGIGADRALDGDIAAAVAELNGAGWPILALDIPSGLHADTGRVLGSVVHASMTLTFLGLKPGLFLGAGCDVTGGLEVVDLGVTTAHAPGAPVLERLTGADLDRALPKRPRSAHKGTSGRLLLVGGGPGMPGAIRLAAEAALRTGAGLVYVAAHPDSAPAVLAGRPEVICRPVATPADLEPLLELADAAAMGPGLGTSEWGRALWARVSSSPLPLVVDADALNLLAQSPAARGRWILTPHPAEAARLLGIATDDVQHDRLGAVRELARRYDAVAVLKGACSLVAVNGALETVSVCDRGNPGMATAGMGDVLTGALGGLLVQTRDLPASARAGVLLHALAGDDAARDGERGTLAGDLLPHLRRWANRT